MLEFIVSLVVLSIVASAIYKLIVITKNTVIKVIAWVGAILTVVTRLVVISLLLAVVVQLFTSSVIHHVLYLIQFNMAR